MANGSPITADRDFITIKSLITESERLQCGEAFYLKYRNLACILKANGSILLGKNRPIVRLCGEDPMVLIVKQVAQPDSHFVHNIFVGKTVVLRITICL